MDLIKSRESRGHTAHVLLNSIFCPNWLDNTLGQILFSLLGLVVTTSLSVREVWGSRLGPVKSDTVSPGTRHRAVFFELRSCVAWALSGGNGPRYSLHTLAEYREYNEGLIFLDFIL